MQKGITDTCKNKNTTDFITLASGRGSPDQVDVQLRQVPHRVRPRDRLVRGLQRHQHQGQQQKISGDNPSISYSSIYS
jgi:hypothetical protein